MERAPPSLYTTKAVDRGTGLGLATVYGIIAKCGGWVACETELGKGTTFTVHLPVVEPSEASVAQASPPADTHELTILVIDDEETVRTSTSRLLAFAGHQVLEASDGREGLAVYRRERQRIDLVLVDLSMPIMSGAETIGAIRELDANARIIVMTGYTPGTFTEADVEVLYKPFSMTDLTDRIAVTMGG